MGKQGEFRWFDGMTRHFEMRMVRWTSGVFLKENRTSKKLRERIWVLDVRWVTEESKIEVVCRCGWRDDDWVKRCEDGGGRVGSETVAKDHMEGYG